MPSNNPVNARGNQHIIHFTSVEATIYCVTAESQRKGRDFLLLGYLAYEAVLELSAAPL